MKARLLWLAYSLRTHRLGETQLDVFGRNLAFIAAAVILLQWLVRGRPILPAWHWLVLALLIAGGLGTVALVVAASRAGFVEFNPQPSLEAPSPREMTPDDKEALYATGTFEVADKRGYLANLSAYWRSFATREHAAMAIQHESRFLLGSVPPDQIGMWYIFFRPEDIDEVTPGMLAFGAIRRVGLRVIYRSHPVEEKKRKAPGRESVYLGFEEAAGRARVWADLLADR